MNNLSFLQLKTTLQNVDGRSTQIQLKRLTDIVFFKYKQSILRVKRFWIFHEVTIDAKLVHQVHKMITAGIYNYLEDIFLASGKSPRLDYVRKNQPHQKMRKNEPQAISLGDKIQACFLIYLVFISVCLICLFAEVTNFLLNYSYTKVVLFNFKRRCSFKTSFVFINWLAEIEISSHDRIYATGVW